MFVFIREKMRKMKLDSNNGTQAGIALMAFSFVFSFWQFSSPTDMPGQQQVFTQDVDTYIPEGFVLLPIELNNGESLEGLLDTKGVVDLYAAGPGGLKKKASAVKMIRSPRRPNHFAVLVPEEKAKFLMGEFKPFHAVIQNPHKTGSKIQATRVKHKRSIIIELDESEHF